MAQTSYKTSLICIWWGINESNYQKPMKATIMYVEMDKNAITLLLACVVLEICLEDF